MANGRAAGGIPGTQAPAFSVPRLFAHCRRAAASGIYSSQEIVSLQLVLSLFFSSLVELTGWGRPERGRGGGGAGGAESEHCQSGKLSLH